MPSSPAGSTSPLFEQEPKDADPSAPIRLTGRQSELSFGLVEGVFNKSIMKWTKNDWPSEQSLSVRLHANGMTDDRLFRGSRNQLELMKTVESWRPRELETHLSSRLKLGYLVPDRPVTALCAFSQRTIKSHWWPRLRRPEPISGCRK